ncbi:SPFH domain-containing protein [Streptomyces rhizoryzae]|uniref:SPFH domain-containing protein n=1 Tax=Streptomyces rhizoryzae TaxID=2932493 RepID=UPI0035580EA1
MAAVDAEGIQLQVVVLVVWRIKDTARALLAVNDHEAYLREQVEAAMARVLSQLPADAFHEDTPTLRDAERSATPRDPCTRELTSPTSREAGLLNRARPYAACQSRKVAVAPPLRENPARPYRARAVGPGR